MNSRKILWGLLASLALAAPAWGQGVLPPVGQTPGAAPANLWSFLCPTAEQKAACKNHWCNSALGQLVSGASGPISAASGGLIQNRCLKNAIENDIAKKAPDSSEGAAARIKKDEAEAKARRMAVRFLGTVDCNYWPEAEEALINSLRGDRNECVRWEAAMALGNGCCCTNKVIKALEHCITGSKEDKFPSERSERVRAAAIEALARCPMPVNGDHKDPEKNGIKKADLTPSTDPKEYYSRVAEMPRAEVVASARATLANAQGGRMAMNGAAPQRAGNLSAILANAFAPRPEYIPTRIEPPPAMVTPMPAAVNAQRDVRKDDFRVMPAGGTSVPRQGVGFVTIDEMPPTFAPLPSIGTPMPRR